MTIFFEPNTIDFHWSKTLKKWIFKFDSIELRLTKGQAQAIFEGMSNEGFELE